MFDDIDTFFYEDVVTPFVAFRDDLLGTGFALNSDRRRAAQSLSSLYHFREHLPSSIRLERKQAIARCSDYRIAGDVANCYKHNAINRDAPLVDSLDHIWQVIVITQFEDAEGGYSDTRKRVYATLRDGKSRCLHEVATNVLNFWGAYLVQQGVRSAFRPFPMPPSFDSVFIKRADAHRIDLSLVKGHSAALRFQFRTYDAASGKAKPLDLTGSKLTFRVYRPRYELFVQMLNKDGKTVDLTTVLIEGDDALAYARCNSEAERKAFLARFTKGMKIDVKLSGDGTPLSAAITRKT